MVRLPGQKERMRAREYHWRADLYIYIYIYIYSTTPVDNIVLNTYTVEL